MKKEAVERDKYAKQIGKVLAVAERNHNSVTGEMPRGSQTLGSVWAPQYSQVTHVKERNLKALTQRS